MAAGFHKVHFNMNGFQLLTVQFGLEPEHQKQKCCEIPTAFPIPTSDNQCHHLCNKSANYNNDRFVKNELTFDSRSVS